MAEPRSDLDRVIATAAKAVAPLDAARFDAFARAYLSGAGRGSERALAGATAAGFAFASARAPGTIRVAAANPADRPGRTVIQILQDDRPFIVDTARLVLRRAELRERLFLHPILPIRRDAAGAFEHIDAASDAPRESALYIEVSPGIDDAAALTELEASLRDAMQKVRDVTEDHAQMLAAVAELDAQLDRAGPALPDGAERARRVRGFLEWLASDHFVLVGFRRYELRPLGEGAGFEVELVPGTGLGLFRDDATSRLRAPRRGTDVPDELRDILDDPRILVIGKSRIESPIHRHGRLDRVAVTVYDDSGQPSGLAILFGLFTSRALRTPGSQVPLLSSRLEEILRREAAVPRSHRYRAIVGAFDSAPLEVLLGTDVDGVAALIHEIVESEGSKGTRLVLRADRHGRSLYVAVLLPRERYGETLRAHIRAHLDACTGATYVDDRASFLEEGVVVLHYFCTTASGRLSLPDPALLEAEIEELSSRWEDRFEAALALRFGEREGMLLADRYTDGYPELLRVATHPVDAVRGVVALEALAASGAPHFALYFDHGDERHEISTLDIFLPDQPLLLSDLLPVIDGFGIRVVDAQQVRVTTNDRREAPSSHRVAMVATLRVLPLGAEQRDLDAIAGRLGDAIRAVLQGAVASDPLNGLVLGAGLEWREIDCIRAYLEYFLQIQGTLARPFLRSVLLENPLAVRLLIQLHAARLDPAVEASERSARELQLQRAFEGYRDRITSLNEDRALSGLYALVMATLRSSFFAKLEPPHRIAMKIDSALVPEIAPPRPWREIFVHSAEMQGIHLRGGPVARGGLRWSDRFDDLRVEVLGLMRTQQLKNGLIVPVGAKGGFVLKRSGLSPSEARKLADEQYRVFVASLLDLTDNLDATGKVLPPQGADGAAQRAGGERSSSAGADGAAQRAGGERSSLGGVVRRDGDDPYLVVAADKGTAHLSDAANEIALARDFWLGDAFASGGSEGYDHKKFAITARGAWECAKQHFAELDIDPEREGFTAAGIGDMSGDVFGNGALLMRRAKLLAAFDHRHVFVDPDPDPEIAWNERRRLFELPTSSWADYDVKKISAGGGVFARAAKQIDLAPALRERFGLGPGRISGYDLVRAILSLDVDLLWNGGIGTYVRASHESNADVGDRANDAVRIDARALRARIVAEGGNLGFTQAARIEASLAGVRIDTDAVDNSGGVDLSDHEVNYKILLAPLVRSGRLSAEQRHAALFGASADACESVLAHNRGQALALSLDERRSRHEPQSYARVARALCDEADLDPAALGLPSDTVIAERAAQGRGFARPELAVMLGLAKLVTRRALALHAMVDAPYLAPLFAGYFPRAFRDAWPDALREHRLRREITALVITNRLIDAGGAALVSSLVAELGVAIPEVAAALLIAEDVLEIGQRRTELRALPSTVSRDVVYGALLEIDRGVRSVARLLVKSGGTALDAAAIERRRTGLAALHAHTDAFLSDVETVQAHERESALRQRGIPPELARDIAMLPLADRALNVLRLCERLPIEPAEAARVYSRIGEGAGIHWVHRRLRDAEATGLWDRMVLVDLRFDLLDLQRRLTESVLASDPADSLAAADAFLARHEALIEAIEALEKQIAASDGPSALVVLTSRLRGLAIAQ